MLATSSHFYSKTIYEFDHKCCLLNQSTGENMTLTEFYCITNLIDNNHAFLLKSIKQKSKPDNSVT